MSQCRSNFITYVQECMIYDCFLQYRKIDAQIIKGDVFRWKEVLNSSGNQWYFVYIIMRSPSVIFPKYTHDTVGKTRALSRRKNAKIERCMT